MWTVNVFWEEDIPRRGRVEVWTPIRERTGWSQCLLVTDSVPATEQRALHHTESLQVKPLSRVRLFVTPCTVAHQAPQSMGFSQQEYLSGLSFPSPGDLPDPGIEPGSSTLQEDALWSEPSGKPRIIIKNLI